jgi:hypothetical protein
MSGSNASANGFVIMANPHGTHVQEDPLVTPAIVRNMRQVYEENVHPMRYVKSINGIIMMMPVKSNASRFDPKSPLAAKYAHMGIRIAQIR